MTNYKTDPIYYDLKAEYLVAMILIPKLEISQSRCKQALLVETDPDKKKGLRSLIMMNRTGRWGLRSLNRKIRDFYEYCDKNSDHHCCHK